MDRPLSNHEALFSGGGEMGALMREFDWAKTAIGPVDQWSPSLRAAVGILLHSRYPMFLWWGPDLIQLYNDAYRPSLGADRHPHALGRPGREDWGEIWPVIGPMVESVLGGGEATWSEDQLIPITRQGFLEEVYWTFSYSPVLEEDGTVGGVLVVCSENTRQVRAERRLRTIAGITGEAIEAKTAEEVVAITARVLTENAADLPFALLYILSPESNQLRLATAAGLVPGTPASPPLLDLSDASLPVLDRWDLRSVLDTRASALIEDAGARFGGLPGGIWDVPSTSALVLPILTSGHPRPFGLLVAGISPGQVFEHTYRHFLESVAVALATAFANVHTYQEALKRTQELAELDRAKTVFFQNISHEFRTPLTLSLGPLESLLADREHPLLEEQRAHIEMAHHHLLRQLKLVNTLLDFARIESGRADATYQPTDLAQLTRELASAFRSTVEKAGLRLLVDCSPFPEPVYVDRDMWEKIVLNLLSNAFKFTFEGSIQVTLQAMDGSVALRVQDTGVGIREADVSHLFERFYQAHSPRARTQEGSGIGLALVQELVHLHGGSITVESQEGVGTSFTVRLPRGYRHLPAERVKETRTLASVALGTDSYVTEALRWLPKELQPDGETTGQQVATLPFSVPTVQVNEGTSTAHPNRLLIVDDNADMRAYLERLLSPWYQVQLAGDGETALAVARASLPDLIISDVMMPGLDGFALLDALRAERSTASIPVILLSARAGEEAILEGLAGGANDYLTKPFSAREVLARVRLWLEIARLRQEAEQARQHLHDLFMQAPAIICVLRGPSHIYELANPRYHQLVGQRTILGLPIREALPELEGQGLYELLDQVYTSGQPFLGTEIKVAIDRDNDGQMQEGYFNFVYQPTRNGIGAIDGILVHAIEVTEQVQSRQRLQTFLGIVSHELKNPLTSIRGNVDLSLRRLKGALLQVPAEAQTLRGMLDGITHMLTRASQQILFENRLISDLVDSSRIQAEKLELQVAPTDIGVIVQEAVAEQRRIMPGRTISLDLPTSQLPPLLLDADRIGQVVTNYLSNALKYSDTEQEVFVCVEAGEPGVRVSVRDQGEGLDAEVQDHIWERFYRVPGIEVKSGTGIGLGLGLYICRIIVEEHGGHVGVESTKNQGATFWLTLPAPSTKA